MKALAIATLSLLLASCATLRVEPPWKRPDSLREMFPFGEISASEVWFRWRPMVPELSYDRARIDRDWDAKLRDRVAAAEVQAGRAISRCDKFRVSFEIRCWFYYDDRDILIYAETEHWKPPTPSVQKPNKALEPTTGSVTGRADARPAPAPVVAHL